MGCPACRPSLPCVPCQTEADRLEEFRLDDLFASATDVRGDEDEELEDEEL